MENVKGLVKGYKRFRKATYVLVAILSAIIVININTLDQLKSQNAKLIEQSEKAPKLDTNIEGVHIEKDRIIIDNDFFNLIVTKQTSQLGLQSMDVVGIAKNEIGFINEPAPETRTQEDFYFIAYKDVK